MTREARQRRIRKLVERYQRLMALDHWMLTLRFESEPSGAACAADDEYLQATLVFDLDTLAEADDDATVRHELSHCLTWELLRCAEHLAGERPDALEMVRAASERCTTMIERMRIWQTH